MVNVIGFCCIVSSTQSIEQTERKTMTDTICFIVNLIALCIHIKNFGQKNYYDFSGKIVFSANLIVVFVYVVNFIKFNELTFKQLW